MEGGLGSTVTFGNVKEDDGTHWAYGRSRPQAWDHLGDHYGHTRGCRQLQCTDLGGLEPD